MNTPVHAHSRCLSEGILWLFPARRLNAEYKSLMAIEAEQKTLIDKLRNNEI